MKNARPGFKSYNNFEENPNLQNMNMNYQKPMIPTMNNQNIQNVNTQFQNMNIRKEPLPTPKVDLNDEDAVGDFIYNSVERLHPKY